MSEFSERMEKCFFELYTTTDLLMVIVRGHLYCEFALSEILRGKFSNPKEINIDRLDYRAKVNLCSALGCFDSINLKQGLIMLGEMRNKYVHNLYYKVTDQDQLNFVNTLKSSLGKPSQYYFRRKMEFPNGFIKCILAIWLPLEMMLYPKDQLSDMPSVVAKMASDNLGVPYDEFVGEVNETIKKFT